MKTILVITNNFVARIQTSNLVQKDTIDFLTWRIRKIERQIP